MKAMKYLYTEEAIAFANSSNFPANSGNSATYTVAQTAALMDHFVEHKFKENKLRVLREAAEAVAIEVAPCLKQGGRGIVSVTTCADGRVILIDNEGFATVRL